MPGYQEKRPFDNRQREVGLQRGGRPGEKRKSSCPKRGSQDTVFQRGGLQAPRPDTFRAMHERIGRKRYSETSEEPPQKKREEAPSGSQLQGKGGGKNLTEGGERNCNQPVMPREPQQEEEGKGNE